MNYLRQCTQCVHRLHCGFRFYILETSEENYSELRRHIVFLYDVVYEFNRPFLIMHAQSCQKLFFEERGKFCESNALPFFTRRISN